MDELAEAVGAPLPPHLQSLQPADRAALAALVRQAVRSRSKLIDSAIEDSLRYLPALLRGPVKRALGM